MKKGNLKALGKWRAHLDKVRKANPTKSLKECMVIAKKSYSK